MTNTESQLTAQARKENSLVRLINHLLIGERRRNAFSSNNFLNSLLRFFSAQFLRLEAACISASETSSEDFLFLLMDSKDIVFVGQIAGEKVSLVLPLALSFFEALLL
jgi:hypothetical protein